MTEPKQKSRVVLERVKPTAWWKIALASIVGAGGAGGISGVVNLPINFNAQEGYEAVQEAYPNTEIEVRSWRPYTFRLKDGERTVIVETSMFTGQITDRW